MADHSRYVALAQKLITAQGRQVTLQIVGSPATDITKPWKGTSFDNVVKEYKAMAVEVPPFGRELGLTVKDDDLLKRAQRFYLVEPIANDLEEKIARIKEKDGTLWNIVLCQALKPADQTILYAIGARR